MLDAVVYPLRAGIIRFRTAVEHSFRGNDVASEAGHLHVCGKLPGTARVWDLCSSGTSWNAKSIRWEIWVRSALVCAFQIVTLSYEALYQTAFKRKGSLYVGRCLHGSSRTTWDGWSRAMAAWPTVSSSRMAGELQPVLHSSR